MSLVPVKNEEIEQPEGTNRGAYTQLELSTVVTDEGRVVLRFDETVAVSSTTSQKCDDYVVPKTEPQTDSTETVLSAAPPRGTSPDTTNCFNLKQEPSETIDPSPKPAAAATVLSDAAATTPATILSNQERQSDATGEHSSKVCQSADKTVESEAQTASVPKVSDNAQGPSHADGGPKETAKDPVLAEETTDTNESVLRFRCEECNKTFEDSAILELHRKKHSRQKPFHCTQCRKSFTSYFILMQHLLVHSKSPEKAKAQENDQFNPQCDAYKKHGTEKLSPDKDSSDKLSPVKLSPGKLSPEELSPGKLSPEKMSACKVSPEKMLSEIMSPGKETPEETSPGKVSPEKMSPDRVSPQKLSPDLGSSPEKDPYQSPHSSSQIVSKSDPDVVCEKSTSPGLVSSSSESQKTVALKRESESETKDICTSSSVDCDNSCEPSTSDSADCILVSYRHRSSTESSKSTQSAEPTLDFSKFSPEKPCKTESQTGVSSDTSCERLNTSIGSKGIFAEKTITNYEKENCAKGESGSDEITSKSVCLNKVLTIDLCSVTDDSSQASSFCEETKDEEETLSLSEKDDTTTGDESKAEPTSRMDTNLRSPGWYPQSSSADVNESQVWEKMVEEDNSQSSISQLIADQEKTIATNVESHDDPVNPLPSNCPTMHKASPKINDKTSTDETCDATSEATSDETFNETSEASGKFLEETASSSAKDTPSAAKEHPTIRSLLEANSGTAGLKTVDGAICVNQSVTQDVSKNVSKSDVKINESDLGVAKETNVIEPGTPIDSMLDCSASTDELDSSKGSAPVDLNDSNEEIDYEVFKMLLGGGSSDKTSAKKTQESVTVDCKSVNESNTKEKSTKSVKDTTMSVGASADKPKRPVGRPRKHPVGGRPRGRPPSKARNTTTESCSENISELESNAPAKVCEQSNVKLDVKKAEVKSKSVPKRGRSVLKESVTVSECKDDNPNVYVDPCESVEKTIESSSVACSTQADCSAADGIQSVNGDISCSGIGSDSKVDKSSLSVKEVVSENDKAISDLGTTSRSENQSQQSKAASENAPEEKKFYGTGAVISQRMLERIAELKGKIKKVKKHKKKKKKDLLPRDMTSSTDTEVNEKVGEGIDVTNTEVSASLGNPGQGLTSSEIAPKKTKKKKHKKDKANPEVSKKKKRKVKKCKECLLSGQKCPHIKKKKRKKKDRKLREQMISNLSLVSVDTACSAVETKLVSEPTANVHNDVSKSVIEGQSAEKLSCGTTSENLSSVGPVIYEKELCADVLAEGDLQKDDRVEQTPLDESRVEGIGSENQSSGAQVVSETRSSPRTSGNSSTNAENPSPPSRLRGSPRRLGRPLSRDTPTTAASRVLRNRVGLAKPSSYSTELTVSSQSKVHSKLPPPACKLTRLPNGRLLREITGPLPVRSQLYFLKQLRNSTDSDETKSSADSDARKDVNEVQDVKELPDVNKLPVLNEGGNVNVCQDVNDKDDQEITEVPISYEAHKDIESGDTAVGDGTENTADAQVDATVTDQVDATVTDQVDATVTDQVDATVTDQVDATVTDQVDATVTDNDEQAAEDVSSEVTDAQTEIYTDDGGDTELEDNDAAVNEENTLILSDCISAASMQDLDTESVSTIPNEEDPPKPSDIFDEGNLPCSDAASLSEELPCESEMTNSKAYRKSPKDTKTKLKSKKKFEWNDIQEAFSTAKKKRKKRFQCDCAEVSDLNGVLSALDLGPIVPRTGPIAYNLASVLEGCPLFSDSPTPPLCTSSPSLPEGKTDIGHQEDGSVTDGIHVDQSGTGMNDLQGGSNISATPIINELPGISNESHLQTISGAQQMPFIFNLPNLPMQSQMYQPPLQYIFPAGSQYALPISVPISTSTGNQFSFIPNLQNFQVPLQNFQQQPLLHNYTFPQNVPLMQNLQFPQTLSTLQNFISQPGTLQQTTLQQTAFQQTTMQQQAATQQISLVQNIVQGDACQLASPNQVIMPQNSMPQNIQTIPTIPPVQAVQQTLQGIQSNQISTDLTIQQQRSKNQRFILPAPKKPQSDFSQILMNPGEITGPTFASVAQAAKSKSKQSNVLQETKSDAATVKRDQTPPQTPEKSRSKSPKIKREKKLSYVSNNNDIGKKSQGSSTELPAKITSKSTPLETIADKAATLADASVSTPSESTKESEKMSEATAADSTDASSPEQKISPPLTRSKKLQDARSLRSARKQKGISRLIRGLDSKTPKTPRSRSIGSEERSLPPTRARRLGMSRSRSSTPEPKKMKIKEQIKTKDCGEESLDESVTSEVEPLSCETAANAIANAIVDEVVAEHKETVNHPDTKDTESTDSAAKAETTDASAETEQQSSAPAVDEHDDNDVFNFTDTEDYEEVEREKQNANQDYEKDSAVSEIESVQSQASSAIQDLESESETKSLPVPEDEPTKYNTEEGVVGTEPSSEDKLAVKSVEGPTPSTDVSSFDPIAPIVNTAAKTNTDNYNEGQKQLRANPLKRNKQVKLPRIPQDQLIGLNRRMYRSPILNSMQKYERVKLIINESLEKVKNSINIDDGCSFEEKLVKELNNGLNSCKKLHDGLPRSRGFPKLAISKDLSSLKILIFWESGKEPCTVTITQNQVPSPPKSVPEVQTTSIHGKDDSTDASNSSSSVDEQVELSSSLSNSDKPESLSVSPKSIEKLSSPKSTPTKGSSTNLQRSPVGMSPQGKTGFTVKKSGKSPTKFRVASKGALISVRTIREKSIGSQNQQENSSQPPSHSSASSQSTVQDESCLQSNASESIDACDNKGTSSIDGDPKNSDENSQECDSQNEQSGSSTLPKEEEFTFKWTKSSFQGRTYNNRKRKRDDIVETEHAEKPSNDPEKVFQQDDAFDKAKTVGCPKSETPVKTAGTAQGTAQDEIQQPPMQTPTNGKSASCEMVLPTSEDQENTAAEETAAETLGTVSTQDDAQDDETAEVVPAEIVDLVSSESDCAESSQDGSLVDKGSKSHESEKYYLSASELLGLQKPDKRTEVSASPNVTDAVTVARGGTGNLSNADQVLGKKEPIKISPIRTRANARSAITSPRDVKSRPNKAKVIKVTRTPRKVTRQSSMSIGISTRRRSALSPSPLVSAIIKTRKIHQPKRTPKQSASTKEDQNQSASSLVAALGGKEVEEVVSSQLQDIINAVCTKVQMSEEVKRIERADTEGEKEMEGVISGPGNYNISEDFPKTDLPCPSPATLDSSLLDDLDNFDAQKSALLDDSFGANDNEDDSVKDAVDCILEMLDGDKEGKLDRADFEENAADIHSASVAALDNSEPSSPKPDTNTSRATSAACDLESVNNAMTFMLDMIDSGKMSDNENPKKQDRSGELGNLRFQALTKEKLQKLKTIRSRSADSIRREFESCREHQLRDCYVNLENIDIEKEISLLKSGTGKSLSKRLNLKRRGSMDCLPVFVKSKIELKDCFVKLQKMEVEQGHTEDENELEIPKSSDVTNEKTPSVGTSVITQDESVASSEVCVFEEMEVETVSSTASCRAYSDESVAEPGEVVPSKDGDGSKDRVVRLVINNVDCDMISSEIKVSDSWDDGDVLVICCEEKMEGEVWNVTSASAPQSANEEDGEQNLDNMSSSLGETCDDNLKSTKLGEPLKEKADTDSVAHASKEDTVQTHVSEDDRPQTGISEDLHLLTDLTAVVRDTLSSIVDTVVDDLNAEKASVGLAVKDPKNADNRLIVTPKKYVPKRRKSLDDCPLIQKRFCTDLEETAPSVSVSSSQTDFPKPCGPLRTRRSSADSFLNKDTDAAASEDQDEELKQSFLQNTFPTLSKLLSKQKPFPTLSNLLSKQKP